MKDLKELIRRKKFITLFLSLFIFLTGLLILIFDLVMIMNTDVIRGDNIDKIILISITIFGIILVFIGYIIPKLILKSEHNIEDEENEIKNEKKDVIKNIEELKLANDAEKQYFITQKGIKSRMTFPKIVIISLTLWIGIVLFMVSIIQEEQKIFLLVTGIICVVVAIIIYYINRDKNKDFIKDIMKSNVYIANCYAYDRKREEVTTYDYIPDHNSRKTITQYYIKITDGNYFIDRWFLIDYIHYNDKTINVKLYVSDEIDIYDVVYTI